MLLLSLASSAHAACAQSAQPDLRRTPLPPPGHTVVPGEVPVHMPPPCADTTTIYQYADTLRGVHQPLLVGVAFTPRVPDGVWHADFTIGTTGSPDPSSIVVTWNGRPSSNARSHDTIEALQFQPASLNGRAVRFKAAMDLHAGGG
ncbi:MAG TPA: hypothetical protein VF151_04335 [Gemmatimonadales bacterium]|jgi:hypothetical protein